MVSIIVCSTPKNEEDEYYCPYCGFKSKDIEEFAVGMCWDCVFSEDEEETEVENGL